MQFAILDFRHHNQKKKDDRFEVEKRSDGFFYITKVPKNCDAQTSIGVGDRVLEIIMGAQNIQTLRIKGMLIHFLIAFGSKCKKITYILCTCILYMKNSRDIKLIL
jgi:hypothetical protein